jgi:exodeoxyribonuclease V alpha subunit
VADVSPIPDYLDSLFPKAGEETLHLLAGAAEQGGFLTSDLHSLRDLLELSGYQDRPAAYALILALMAALEDGSLCVAATAPSLSRRLSDFAGAEAPAWAERILAELKLGLSNLIGQAGDQDRPILLAGGPDIRHLYFQKHLRCEQELHQALLRRLQREAALPGERVNGVLQEVLRERALLLGGQPLQLDGDQQAALAVALCENLAIISGGPGTGKTSIVFTLLRCLARLGFSADRIALAAPTGRAARRMTDAIQNGLAALGERAAPADQSLGQLEATTLHQLLGYVPFTGGFRRHRENPVPADLVIVDEVSMVGIELMARLVEGVRPEARLVLLGDKDQLPAVEAGAVLAHLMPDSTSGFSPELRKRLTAWFGPCAWPAAKKAILLSDRVALLRTNHRSQPAIRAAAQAINEEDADLADRLPAVKWPAPTPLWSDLAEQGGCWLWTPASANADELQRILDHWARHAYLAEGFIEDLRGCRLGPEAISADDQPALRRSFARLEQHRLLTVLREGPWGARRINDYLAHIVRGRVERYGQGPLFAGAPVLVTRNDSAQELYNGDVGLAVRGQGGGIRVVFRRQHQFVSFAPESLPAHELAFALTVHKSQGSEYGEVLVVLPPEAGRRLLTKELLYTAVTRAKQLAIICATKETVRYAVARAIVREAAILRF